MSEFKKYAWEHKEDTEVWRNDTFETIDECVNDYKKNYADESLEEFIFVGEVEPFVVGVNSIRVINDLEEQAYDECGECAEDWEPSSIKEIEKWDELDAQLTKVVTDWLGKHGMIPDFYTIKNIRKVAVNA